VITESGRGMGFERCWDFESVTFDYSTIYLSSMSSVEVLND
jgi:hypothetical protein